MEDDFEEQKSKFSKGTKWFFGIALFFLNVFIFGFFLYFRWWSEILGIIFLVVGAHGSLIAGVGFLILWLRDLAK